MLSNLHNSLDATVGEEQGAKHCYVTFYKPSSYSRRRLLTCTLHIRLADHLLRCGEGVGSGVRQCSITAGKPEIH